MTAPEPRSRLRIGVGAGVVLVLLALASAVLFAAVAPRGTSSTVAPATVASTSAASTAAPAGDLYVHVLGAVANPGLYELRSGARAVDVVAAAGGFTAKADQSTVNLARFVTDGEQIVVPEKGAVATAAPGAGAVTPGKVNLNTADETELETLPRVGPAMAQRIIDWRTKNGRFTTIEDLMSVTGVGDKTFADLKDLVTV